MNGYLLDTNIISEYNREGTPHRPHWAKLTALTCTVNWRTLLQG